MKLGYLLFRIVFVLILCVGSSSLTYKYLEKVNDPFSMNMNVSNYTDHTSYTLRWGQHRRKVFEAEFWNNGYVFVWGNLDGIAALPAPARERVEFLQKEYSIYGLYLELEKDMDLIPYDYYPRVAGVVLQGDRAVAFTEGSVIPRLYRHQGCIPKFEGYRQVLLWGLDGSRYSYQGVLE